MGPWLIAGRPPATTRSSGKAFGFSIGRRESVGVYRVFTGFGVGFRKRPARFPRNRQQVVSKCVLKIFTELFTEFLNGWPSGRLEIDRPMQQVQTRLFVFLPSHVFIRVLDWRKLGRNK